jgi:hypothetical protein
MNRKLGNAAILFAALFFFAAQARAQQSAGSQNAPQKQDDMPGMDMSSMHHDTSQDSAAAQSANEAMAGHHMDMGAHMFMTDLRPANPADEKRAEEIVATLRKSIEKYRDYHVALAEGFQIFHPEVPQDHYHFTNYRYAFEAQFAFNPALPTSLLYKRTADGYELEGAMYTAPKKATEEELNSRVPLSVARWHKHVNLCLPPKGAQQKQVNLKEFGFRGSIATQEACETAGGRWIPQIFGWMVHVYPFEADPEKIWAH